MDAWFELGILHLTLGMVITFLFSIVLALVVQATRLFIGVAEKINSVRKADKMFKTYKDEILVGVLSSILYNSEILQKEKATPFKPTSVKARPYSCWSLAGRFEYTDFIGYARNWTNSLGWASLSKAKFYKRRCKPCA